MATPQVESPPTSSSTVALRCDTSGVTWAGIAARSVRQHNANNNPTATNLAAIHDGKSISELRRLGLFTIVALLDVMHQTCGAESIVEYDDTTTSRSNFSAEKKVMKLKLSKAFSEAMSLSAEQNRKTASNKETASLTTNTVNACVPAISIPTGNKVIAFRWGYNKKADNSYYKGGVVVLSWGQALGIDCGSGFTPVCSMQSIRMVLAVAAEYNLECRHPGYNNVAF